MVESVNATERANALLTTLSATFYPGPLDTGLGQSDKERRGERKQMLAVKPVAWMWTVEEGGV